MMVSKNNKTEPITLQQLRTNIRSSQFDKNTSGLMPGLVQGNIVIMPTKAAEEFIEFCALNDKPCPVIGFSQPGDPGIPNLGKDIDIRIDVPEYLVFEQGQLTHTETDISRFWNEDSVAIVIGCSYSFEDALIDAGYPIRNIDLGVNVSMYDTNIPTISTKNFSGNTVVSMRPFKRKDVEAVTKITENFSKTHGGPIHVGDPSAIGIKDINNPDYGSPVPIKEDEVPVFWGCGVTSQRILKKAKLPLLITHVPGKMLITDLRYEQL